ncbi:aminotransferase class IV [Desulfosporosinus youngiae]|uniref:Branched-chain amino acid aminotransferase/4-amino-4-deoxychorismate lyase n=1 Tax=Desulfosporosinus youngiae DSM 17734 TaxID=768710 RepID=H5XVQ9_9FIRM|nr:aminotransferase class IV [Desulfosporosinus youngiae]EHQ90215.1 branched-chain amino acid aminotransferase/4-amino-4-deoxychorismate lyase [Desulfosporosinus youngiae DSM 17734]
MNSSTTLLANDRLALFGFGLFETLLITDYGPLFADLHWQRLHRGAQILGLVPPDQQEWLQHIQAFMEQTPGTTPYALRITLSGGAPLAGLPSQLLFQRRSVPYTPAQYTAGIQLHLLTSPRNEHSPLCTLKSTNYLENILAKEEAALHGCEEGLWLNTQGYLAEGTMSNLFFLKNGALFTPSLSSGCLPGTRRQLILELARALQIPTHEGLYTFSDLLSSDEIFMTNALMGIMPVRKIQNLTLTVSPPGSLNSAMRCLELGYAKLSRGNS